MNSNDLIDVIGEAKEPYVLDAVNTRNGVQHQTKRISLNRGFLIAAIIAVMLLLVGCTIAYVLSLQELKISEINVIFHYGDDGKRQAPTEETRDVIAVRGYPGSANQRATLEWLEFEQTYDPNLELMENENVHGIPDNYYHVYNCYTWEKANKMDEICQKYGLKLLSTETIVQRWQTDIFFDAIDIGGMILPNSNAIEAIGSGYFYPEGNFKYDFDFTLTTEDAWPYEIWATMLYSKMDFFDPDTMTLRIDDYEQWNYTTSSGMDVLIAVKDSNGFIFAEQGDAYITVSLNMTMMLSDSITQRAAKEDFELAADCINLGIQPKTENMVAAVPAMEAADQAHWEAQEALKPDYSQYSNYSDYLINSINGGNMTGWCTVMDVNGDGINEFLKGVTPDSFESIATITDNGISEYLYVTTGYYCGDSIIEIFNLEGPEEYYSFYKIIPGVIYGTEPYVHPELLEFLMYDTETDIWYTGKELGKHTQISKEEAEVIRGQYNRIDLNMTPITEYPMDENGTTLLEFARQNTNKLTEEDRLAIYSDIIKKNQETAYYPSNYYCLMDINGDGIEDLLLGETAEYFGDAYTIFNGKSATIHFWSHMNMCENNFLEITGSSSNRESHLYYRMEENGRTFIEAVYYTYYPESWSHQVGLQEKWIDISKSEFDAIVASYPRIVLDMKPITEFPLQ